MTAYLNLTDMSAAIENVSGTILDYALLLAAVGTIAMAVLELLKGAFRVRLLFHRIMVTRWVKGAAPQEELLALAAGGTRNANILYDQPSERMLGQIQAAANVALDFPSVYPNIYEFLTRGSAVRVFRDDRRTDQERWRAFADRIATSGAQSAPDEDARLATQARARLGNLVTRRIDAFQAMVEYWWARINQSASIVLGAAFFGFAFQQSQTKGIHTLTLITVSLLAGLIAPFAKDVVAALTGLRARRA